MKAKELRAKNVEELSGLLLERKKELFNLRFQKAAGELQNSSRFLLVRKDIARINTLLREKQANKAA